MNETRQRGRREPPTLASAGVSKERRSAPQVRLLRRLNGAAAVFTARRVYARSRQNEALYRRAAGQMALDDLLNVIGLDEAVPYRLGIHHDRHAVFTLIETPGLVDSHSVREPVEFAPLLQGITDGQ